MNSDRRDLKALKLEIVDFVDDTRWRWRLLDDTGAYLADHEVKLDPAASEYGGYCELYAFVHWNAASWSKSGSEQTLIERVAKWIRSEVWGDIGTAMFRIAEQEPIVVEVILPETADILLFRPLELPLVTAGSPSSLDISLVFNVAEDSAPPPKREVGESLRMLALFSVPADQAALDVRRERLELRRLAQRSARMDGHAVELRVLQYGVTRKSLEDVLEEGEGWDVIHFSGHGLPAGLVLEHEDGSADMIHSEEFVELLHPTRSQLKLVTMNSCESGATTAEHAMQLLGITDRDSPSGSVVDEVEKASHAPLPAVAQRLARELGCAVLAMRYPVEDEFAIELSAELYEGLFTNGQTLPRALQRVLAKKVSLGGDTSRASLSLATPALFGIAALNLRLQPPRCSPEIFDPSRAKLAYFEPEPEQFVGRVAPLAKASSALSPKSQFRGVLFHGMAGAGKTACALELAYRYEDIRFEAMAWHQAPSEGHDIEGALAQFAIALETQIKGLTLTHVIDDAEKLERFLPRLRHLMANRSLLIVLDNIESLLSENGEWRDPLWAQFTNALIDHNGLSRLVMTSRVPPSELRDNPRIKVEPIHSLSATESVLLARKLPNLGKLMSTGGQLGQPAGRELVRRALELVQGNPKLIELADRQAEDHSSLKVRIEEADDVWAGQADLSVFFKTGQPDVGIAAADFLRVIDCWTLGIAETLTSDTRLMFQLLCCLESRDRRLKVVEPAAPLIWKKLSGSDRTPDLPVVIASLIKQGLIEVERLDSDERYQIHPAIEQAERKIVEPQTQEAVDIVMAGIWSSLHQMSADDLETKLGVFSGLAAAPYLLRLGEVDSAVLFLSRVATLNPAPNTFAAVLPYLHRALAIAQKPIEKRRAQRALLSIRAMRRSGNAVPEMRELIELARTDGDNVGAAVLESDLIEELIRGGAFKEAKKLIDARLSTNEQSLGAWIRLGDEARRLQAMHALGETESVISEIQPLIDRIDQTEDSEGPVQIKRWDLRERIFATGRLAAKSLKDWEMVLQFNASVRESEKARGAPEFRRARTDYNDHSALIELGRLDEAEDSLRRLRLVAEREGDLQFLGKIIDAWATLEAKRGHTADAVAFSLHSLQLAYKFDEPQSINVSHHNLSNHLERADHDNPGEIVAHRLAEVLISYQTDSGEYVDDLSTLARTLARTDGRGLTDSFEELCAQLEESAEVDFVQVFNRLPLKSPDGQLALTAVINNLSQLVSQAKAAEKPQ
jgi:tetratricopeptide (TPR) repeat protein